MRKEIISVIFSDKKKIDWEEEFTDDVLNELFDDDRLIGFALR